MAYILQLNPEAIDEINESYRWYEDRLVGLGERFILAVNQRLNSILAMPEMFPKEKGRFRKASVKDFPFTIIYEILRKERVVLVSYVFHTKRNPRLKYKR